MKDERIEYCREAPFHPQERYPEYPFAGTCSDNRVYGRVRELFYRLGLDRERYGKPEWNPLGTVIWPGDNVVVKPNFVFDRDPRAGPDGQDALTTHGSVIRAVVDYAYIALRGAGRITVCDAPYMETDFPRLMRRSGVDQIAAYYEDAGARLDVLDLRRERRRLRAMGGVAIEPLAGDPRGYSAVDLGQDSDHYEIIRDAGKFRVSYYSKREMAAHHNEERNEYFVCNTILNADVILNVPKLKTHARSGITCAMKNMVGINGIKDWVPHHRSGPAEDGGDEYIHRDLRKDLFVRLKDDQYTTNNMLYVLPERAVSAVLFFSKFIVPFRDDYIGGNWHGNDTIPRTVSDLNKIIFYADRRGVMRDTPQRRMFVVVDGVTGGERDGPMTNRPRPCGVLLAGHSPVAVDLACATVMGFDHRKIPTFTYALGCRKYRYFEGRPEDVDVSPAGCRDLREVYERYNCGFEPPDGWKGHIEYEAWAQAVPPLKVPAPQKA